jgi:hypothetical protein
MITPEMPACGLVRQAVLNNQSDRQRDDAMRVMGLWQGVLGHVGVEVFPTTRATVLRINQVNITWPPGNPIADVMENASGCSAAKTGFTTMRTRAMGEVAAAMNDLGFGQIFGSCDAFGGIRQILSRTRHDKALLGQLVWPRDLHNPRVRVIADCLF